MKIKEIIGKKIKDSRKEDTIEISIKSELGTFVASSPSGKSTGKYETSAFIKKPEHDIITLRKFSDKIYDFKFDNLLDLKKIENVIQEKIGANTLFALESAILKAVAAEQRISLWQLINPKAKKMPFPVGNCIEGGSHSNGIGGKKPDFQEFLIIPKTKNFSDNVFLMKKAWKLCEEYLKLKKSKGGFGDENAWSTSLSNEETLEILNKVRDEIENDIGEEIGIGIDVASSGFFTGFVYDYKNYKKVLTREKQIKYINELIEKYDLAYVEDALQEEDFNGFKIIREKVKSFCLIVGDDLTVSKILRLKKAIELNSINSIIVKPNQTGSLIEIYELVKLAKKFGIKTIFSHRSGETLDYSLSDLAFGFQADYIKTGIEGKEREIKLKRLIDIEKNF